MDLLRRFLGEGDSDCSCGHSRAVHWRHVDGPRMWCSAPGCTCSVESNLEDPSRVELEEGDGFRIVRPRAKRRKSA
jgi:hypothetical protein